MTKPAKQNKADRRARRKAYQNPKLTKKRNAFYKSWEWRQLRFKTLEKYDRRCMCCGATPDQETVLGEPVRLVVDHIKPVVMYWDLRLDPDNLQVLCDECNMGKGSWSERDFRIRMIEQQLKYEI